ncbi:fungal-specific transcription factor domain-containing protein [Lophiotrema nucula]|uniref:Fungal-specific transcription factor domain-containing protein n=1 Tax=Lophiotrema nucula TaxID=690887 RepID=A0A6A5YPW5_9PLEO|nr:fungal-specific transcription factor domain-containing protein [Lophiotrema nucula]
MDESDELSSRNPITGRPFAKRRRISDGATNPTRELGLMRNVPGDKLSSFVGSSSGIYFIRSVYGALRQSSVDGTVPNQTPDSDIVPGEDDHLPSIASDSRRIWKDSEVTTQHTSHFTFDKLVGWSSSYFAHWHPAYPFLHAPAVLEHFEKVSRAGFNRPETADSVENIILRSIMSISLADRRQSQHGAQSRFPADLVFESYESAIDSLQRILSRPTTIRSLQAAISVQLFLVSMLRLNAASRLGGLIIRMALQQGLHRCPNRFPAFSPSDRQLRQRLFWSIYCLDRYICQSMGLPLGIRDDDIDVCYPSEERHSSEHVAADDRLRLVEFLARHSKIRGQIMELRNKSIYYVHKDPDQDVSITAKLTEWWNNIEDFIDSDEGEPPALSQFHRTILVILKHESVISLNRPILAASSKTYAYNAALQHCIGASRAIITMLHKSIKSSQMPGQPDLAVPLVWPSFTWAIWMSTFILFHATNSKRLAQSAAARLADKSLQILRHLSRRGSVWPEACATAIQDLRTQLTKGALTPGQDITLQPAPQSASVSDTPDARSRSPVTPRAEPRSMPSNSGAATAGPSQRTGAPPSMQPPSDLLASATSRSSSSDRRDGWPLNAAPASRGLPHDPRQHGVGEPMSMASVAVAPPSDFAVPQWSDYMQANLNFDASVPFGGDDGSDPFSGFDIPFWLGQDQYSGMINEWS